MSRNLTLFVLGQKGHGTVRAALQPEFIDRIECVVVGQDAAMQHDFSAEILALCQAGGVPHVLRKDYAGLPAGATGRIAIASGWRWLIHDTFTPLIVCHDSLLPRYRGFNPLVTALLNRDREVGVTAIVANAEFDRGNIIAARSFTVDYPVRVADAMQAMAERFFDLTHDILLKVHRGESLAGEPQDDAQASYSVWRDEEDYRIDWSRSAEDIEHFVDCVSYPYAGASTLLDNELVRIVQARAVPDVAVANRVPGKVLFVEQGLPVVLCGQGLLKITQALDAQGRDALPLPRFRVRFK